MKIILLDSINKGLKDYKLFIHISNIQIINEYLPQSFSLKMLFLFSHLIGFVYKISDIFKSKQSTKQTFYT